jgi:hypothetical protein
MTFFTLVIGEHRPFISLGRQDHSPASDWRVHLKRAVRINIVSSKRDKCVDVEVGGNNVMEAALIAVPGNGRALNEDEL